MSLNHIFLIYLINSYPTISTLILSYCNNRFKFFHFAAFESFRDSNQVSLALFGICLSFCLKRCLGFLVFPAKVRHLSPPVQTRKGLAVEAKQRRLPPNVRAKRPHPVKRPRQRRKYRQQKVRQKISEVNSHRRSQSENS